MHRQSMGEVRFSLSGWLAQLCQSRLGRSVSDFDDKDARASWHQAEALLGVDRWQLAADIANELGLEVANHIGAPDTKSLSFIPRKVAIEFNVFPLEVRADRIVVVASNPEDPDMLSMVGFLTALHVETRVAPPGQIDDWIASHYEEPPQSKPDIVIKTQRAAAGSAHADHSAEDSAIVELVSDMFFEAFSLGASDIHIEPLKQDGIIRYRIDGLLRVITELPLAVMSAMIQRIKAISRLNLANRLIPQDGSVGLLMGGQLVDLRVSTIPVKGGEKAVIRLLVQSTVGSIDEIGLPGQELARFRSLLSHSTGIFIITGPTGSGKSTTLYSALKELNSSDRCLVTVEDPIEYEIEGIAQISVNTAQNVTFNRALRSILRQDPDVILVGEIRDEETAEITFRAAITGHFVMSTLHTNDAMTTISRLVGLGIDPNVIADSLRGVAAQRLVRRLCPDCSVQGRGSDQPLAERFLGHFPDAIIKGAVGCESCGHSGYRGRLPIFEIVTIDPKLADAIRADKPLTELRDLARGNGNRPMSVIAADLVQQGLTSVEEMHRVMGEQFWQGLGEEPPIVS